MVTEPEAAAVYTARYLKEDTGREFLKESLLNFSSLRISANPLHRTENVLFYAMLVEGQS